jgi:hypothetical protein
LFEEVTKNGITDGKGGTPDITSNLYPYYLNDYSPTIGDCALCSGPDDNFVEGGLPGASGYDTSSVFFWDISFEWKYAGTFGATQGPAGGNGPQGGPGPTGPGGQNGVNGLNGAHGGANAQVIPYVPSSGPPGRLYLTESDGTLYVTIRETI